MGSKKLKAILLPKNFSVSGIKLWATIRLEELVGISDDVLVGMVIGMLTDAHATQTPVEPRAFQRLLAPFMNPNISSSNLSLGPQTNEQLSKLFVQELWEYLLELRDQSPAVV